MRKNPVIDARHIIAIGLELVQEYEHFMDWHLRPHYNENGDREYNEHFGSGDRAYSLNEALHRIDPDGFVVAFCFNSEKTLFGSKEALWPMYFTCMNIDPSVRKMQATRRLIGFFPVLRGDWLSGANRRKGQVIWQLILRWVLDPLIRQLHKGILYKKRDGTFIRVYFRLATMTVDLPEICLMLCIYQAFASAARPNPSCTCLRVHFLTQTASHTCTSKKRTTRKMRDILERGDLQKAKEYSFTMQEVRSWHC